MTMINLTKQELLAIQKEIQHNATGSLRGVLKKVDEALKSEEMLEKNKINNLF